MYFSLYTQPHHSSFPIALFFAVATLNSLYVYDTESIQPIVVVAGVHYAAITDIAWSPADNYLVLSSQDGYCTLLEFDNQELGSPVPASEKKQVAGDETKSPIMEGMVEDCSCASVDRIKEKVENSVKEKDENDGKQASLGTAMPQTKAPKRRITPMAIDKFVISSTLKMLLVDKALHRSSSCTGKE